MLHLPPTVGTAMEEDWEVQVLVEGVLAALAASRS